MSAGVVSSADAAAELVDILERGAIRAVYQPIHRLREREIVGYEALARGPVGSPLERPDLLFAVAREEGLVAELDHVCRAAAFEGALEGGLGRGRWLTVNVEPAALTTWAPPRLADIIERAASQLDVVIEITERMLTAYPAALLDLVERARRRGWRIALDDVGADPASLALMPLVAPDIIKLDLRMVQERPSLQIARLVSAVNAEVERSGAVLLAEGIETDEHLQTALSFGAALGQGWLFSRPGDLPGELPALTRPLEFPAQRRQAAHTTPFWDVAEERTPRAARKDLLIEMSKLLEAEAAGLGEAAIVLATFQDVRHFTPATVERYAGLGPRTSFTGVLGRDMPGEPAPGVRGAVIAEDDRLLDEWNIAVLGPHFAAALVARDLGDEGPELHRRFDYVLTYDRELVRRAATAMMRRIEGDHDGLGALPR